MVAESQLSEEAPQARDTGDERESADAAELRAELERTEDRLQQVIERYEALLAERSRAANGEDPVWTDGGVDAASDRDGGGWRAWVRSLF